MKEILLVLMLVSCGKSKAQRVIVDKKSSEVIFNDQSPEDFYQSISYQALGNCNDEKGVSYKKLTPSTYFPKLVIGKNRNDRDVILGVDLYLLKDNQFVAEIEEKEVYRYILNGYEYKTTLKKKIKGSWFIDGRGEINLRSLGVGSPIQVNNKNGLILKIEKGFLRGSEFSYNDVEIKLNYTRSNYSALDECKT